MREEIGKTHGGRHGEVVNTMDLKIVQDVLDLKLHNRYPEVLTSKECLMIRRRADIFRMKGKGVCSISPRT